MFKLAGIFSAPASILKIITIFWGFSQKYKYEIGQGANRNNAGVTIQVSTEMLWGKLDRLDMDWLVSAGDNELR